MRTTSILVALFIAMGAGSGWATATINLNNYGASANPIYFKMGMLLPVEGAYVQVFRINGDSWMPVMTANNESIFALTEPGYFNGGIGFVSGAYDYEVTKFMLVAWVGNKDEPAFPKYGGRVYWTQGTGAWTSSTQEPTGPDLRNPPVYMIPEPSTAVLGLLGGAAVVLFRRKAVG